MSSRLFVMIFLILIDYTYASEVKTKDYENVSIISLIANPEKYDGKAVLVSGYVTVDDEWKWGYLLLDETQFKKSISENAVTLHFNETENMKEVYGFIEGGVD